jgi:hypothetical protein
MSDAIFRYNGGKSGGWDQSMIVNKFTGGF